MATSNESVSMALFCDFENVALGVRDAKYEKFDIKPVLERLLLKGSIVVKKAYCDWERYKGFKASMHEANFELIEIPHVRQSGKNSADIRLVVDALDLCYTKSHVDTFVIISGDSDFSPLVSKLRENAKRVIGVGVKQSTSDLLVANCDEFIFYDDLVRERQRAEAKRAKQEAQAAGKRSADEERRASGDDKRDDDKRRKDDAEARKLEAVEIAVETFDALVSEQGDGGKIWASVLKSAIKRRKPDFNESYYGFRAFGNLLEEARARGLLDFGRDERSGTYVSRIQDAPGNEAAPRRAAPVGPVEAVPAPAQAEGRQEKQGRQRDRNDRDRHSRRRDARAQAAGARPHDRNTATDATPDDDGAQTFGDGGEAYSNEPAFGGHGAADDDWRPDTLTGTGGNGRADHFGHAGHADSQIDAARAEQRAAEAAFALDEAVAVPADQSVEGGSSAEEPGPGSKSAKKPKASRKTPARKTAKKPAPAKKAAASSVDAKASGAGTPIAPEATASEPGGTSNAAPAKSAAKKKAPARSRRPKKAAEPT